MSQYIQGTIRAWGYHIGFDGDILTCKPTSRFVLQPRIEIPVNVLLDYQYRAFPLIGRLDLFINRYSYGQQKPVLRKISPLFIIGPKARQINALLSTFDEVILANLAGSNLGLHHIARTHMEAFYRDRKRGALATSMASMKIAYTKTSEAPDAANIMPLPEQHDLAS